MHETNTPVQNTVSGTDTADAPSILNESNEPDSALPLPERSSRKGGGKAAPLGVVLVIIAALIASAAWGYTFQQKYEKAEQERLGLLVTALNTISVEFRTAHYSLQSFLESGDPGVMAEARAVFGPAVRLAAKVLASAGTALDSSNDLVGAIGTSADRIALALDRINERTKYYGKIQELDRRVVQRIVPDLLSLADATASRTTATPLPDPNSMLTASEKQVALTSALALRATADNYLQMGIMPEDKPVPKVNQAQAVEWARKGMKLGNDYVLKSAVEQFNRWQGTHYWEITFDQGGTSIVVYVNADAARIAGFMQTNHSTLSKGEMPKITRGEALVKARTILPQIQNVPQDLVVGPVEFTGTWQVTFWPRSNGVIYYSHPITVWVDGKTHEPYGYQYLRPWVRPSMPVGVTAGYATTLAKKMAESGWMKEAFATYRGSTYLALYRSEITGEDTPVWAVEFVISSRFHENTGYDMAIVLINSKTGKYEGYKGLGDGPWRVDRWQLK